MVKPCSTGIATSPAPPPLLRPDQAAAHAPETPTPTVPYRDDLADALDALAQHVVGHLEGVADGHVLAHQGCNAEDGVRVWGQTQGIA